MVKTDHTDFAALMAGLGETYGTTLSDERIRIYWMALKDLSLEEINRNATTHIRTNKFFPKPCELRGESEEQLERQAMQDITFVERLCLDFLSPGFQQSGMVAVEEILKEQKKDYLVSLVRDWGAEIWNQSNPTATRAQMLRAYKAMARDGKMLPAPAERAKIPERAEGMIKQVVDTFSS